jgi:hypothetical protein
MIQQLVLDRVAVEPGHGAEQAGDRGAGAAAGFKVAGLPPRRSRPGLFKRLRARGPRRWRWWQRVNAPGLDYFAGMGQSNIESFRPAAGDTQWRSRRPPSLRPCSTDPDDLLERWATILWPAGGAVVSGVPLQNLARGR